MSHVTGVQICVLAWLQHAVPPPSLWGALPLFLRAPRLLPEGGRAGGRWESDACAACGTLGRRLALTPTSLLTVLFRALLSRGHREGRLGLIRKKKPSFPTGVLEGILPAKFKTLLGFDVGFGASSSVLNRRVDRGSRAPPRGRFSPGVVAAVPLPPAPARRPVWPRRPPALPSAAAARQAPRWRILVVCGLQRAAGNVLPAPPIWGQSERVWRTGLW